MVCQPCTDKWIHYYLKKGFRLNKAYRMARKLVSRVERNKSYDRIMQTIHPPPNWSYRYGCSGICGTPPYYNYLCWRRTIACWIDWDCENNYVSSNCADGSSCPYPLPNSTMISKECVCTVPDIGCWMCSEWEWECLLSGACPSPPLGYCYYLCNTGYVWDGSACVSGAPVGGLLVQII